MDTKVVSIINLALALVWLVSCTVAHGEMVVCGTQDEVPCAPACTCADGHNQVVVMPAGPMAPQAPDEHEGCLCEHHATCSGFVPGSLLNVGGVKQSTTASRSSYAAGGFIVVSAGAFLFLPNLHAFAAAAHARQTCLRTTVLRL